MASENKRTSSESAREMRKKYRNLHDNHGNEGKLGCSIPDRMFPVISDGKEQDVDRENPKVF